MSWSTKQVLGFNALIVTVVITAIVGMVTLALFLTMGSPPEGQPLLIAPTPSDKGQPLSSSCDETPHDALIYLPEPCAIIATPPGSAPLQVEFVTHINMRRCTNHMCLDNSCHGNKCCCQEIQTSSLTYYCPNERGALLNDIVDSCGCVPCRDVPVVFVGMVASTDSTPIALAEVTVGERETFSVSDEATFGFTVSSLQHTVVVMVTAVGYWDYRRSLRVVPGEVNVVRVQLMRKMVRGIPATPHRVLVSTHSLGWTAVTSDSDLSPLTSQVVVNVESWIEFPQGMFAGGDMSVVGQAVGVADQASLEGLEMSFVAEPERGRRSGEGEEEMVLMVSSGMVDLVTGDGERVNESMSSLVFHTVFPQLNCSSLTDLHLFLMTSSRLRPSLGHASCMTTTAEQSLLSISLSRPLSLPLSLLLGFPQTHTCYVAARSFATSGSHRSEMPATEVWLHTVQEGPPMMANVMSGLTGQCVSVPCQGRLEVWIRDGLQYTPNSYIVYLDDDLILTSDDIAVEVEVYRTLSECEENALGPTADHFSFFEFIMKPRQPTFMGFPTPDGVNLTTPPFCSLRVGVALSGGVASAYVTASSEWSEGVRMVRVERVGGGDDVTGEQGSGNCADCERTHFTCLQVSCDHQVEVSVSGEDDEVCVPAVTGEAGEGVQVWGDKATLLGSQEVKGRIHDFMGNDASVAMEMCKLNTETDILFRCIK